MFIDSESTDTFVSTHTMEYYTEKKKKDRDESQNNCADRKESEKKVHIVWLYFCETHENAPQ